MTTKFSPPHGRRKRLAVARFWYEGNAFGPVPATMEQFRQYEWQAGPEVLSQSAGTATEMGAVAAFAQQHPDWEVVVLRCAAALPAGPIAESVFDQYVSEVKEGLLLGLTQGGWDAMYLSLHGAAITNERETPELDFVRMVRSMLPDVPLGASFDLHGNMPSEWADVLDFASVYRTHPHIDMAATADRVLEGLVAWVTQGLRTRLVLRNEGIVLPSINMRTQAGPMHALEQMARDVTVAPVLEVCVFGGFPYSDTAATGSSVMAISDARVDPQGKAATAAAERVLDQVRSLADQFRIELPSPADAVSAALASSKPGLIAVTDSGDNPLSGGGGDTPALFRALIEAQPSVSCLFASFVDPEIVRRVQAAKSGAVLDVRLGGRYGSHFGEGVNVQVRVDALTDGVFRNSGPMHTGVERHCGNTVILRLTQLPDVRVIVTERVVAADDPSFYALHGIDLAQLRLLCVKAKNHFRAAFAERCAEIIDCDAPGPACQDLSALPFRHDRIAAGY
ncbi:MlrC domain-containing protein [Advenella kashmirensis W13003]|uniref:Microcystinase C n=1 Tax=Advenella kashmirensis W13003 TaxID=1424334 RepID=V8QX55_9BURK|nr:M81 family metallopeptidase [Advenella kashmirensis]ETF03943.1 MlrC domain-containing protein [Advenella kashmirensis W13003]